MNNKHCIIIAGPTASGKTARAIQLAKELNTEIISADSRQCFKELKIGVARPTEDQLREVPHHFIANHSIYENITAKTFAEEANFTLDMIFKKSDHAIVCGGTGLYIKALVEGFDDIPAIPTDIRNKVITIHQQGGIEYLRQELLKFDSEFQHSGDTNNPNRMMRALEIVMHTGKTIGSFQTKEKKTIGRLIRSKLLIIPLDSTTTRLFMIV